jgi:SAM-dependent methyltransferase
VNLEQLVFARLYRRSGSVEALPWHRDEPPPLLEQALAERAAPGRALDLGCGQGVYATYLAEQGYEVVGIDFVPAAVEAARARADRAGVDVDLRVGDVLDHAPAAPYDVVLDSGCLHHLPKAKARAYRTCLDQWLAPGGDFVLVHFAHRPKVGWIPRGPSHLTREAAVARFAPLQLRAYDETTFDVGLPMGQMRAGVYWFTRPAG